MYSFFIALSTWFSLGPVGDKKKQEESKEENQEDDEESEEDVKGSEEDQYLSELGCCSFLIGEVASEGYLVLREDAYMRRFGYQLLYIGSIGTSNTDAHALLFLFSVVKKKKKKQ